MSTARALLILSGFFGVTSAMIFAIVARDDTSLVEGVWGVALWAALPVLFWFMWTVLQPLIGRMMGIILGLWRIILSAKFND